MMDNVQRPEETERKRERERERGWWGGGGKSENWEGVGSGRVNSRIVWSKHKIHADNICIYIC